MTLIEKIQMAEALIASRKSIIMSNSAIVEKLEEFLLAYTKYAELKDILVKTHKTPIHHLTICLDLGYLQCGDLVWKKNLSGINIKNIENYGKHQVVSINKDSFIHEGAINRWSNFEIRDILPEYLMREKYIPLQMTMMLNILHELGTDSLLYNFEGINVPKKDILNRSKLPELGEFFKYYKYFSNLVDAESTRIGINELCISKEAYNVHIQNECCLMMIPDFEKIESDVQRKFIFDKMITENPRR